MACGIDDAPSTINPASRAVETSMIQTFLLEKLYKKNLQLGCSMFQQVQLYIYGIILARLDMCLRRLD